LFLGRGSADDQRVVTTSADGTVRIWDVATGAGTVFQENETGMSAASWNGDGSRLATASLDGRIWVWDTDTASASTASAEPLLRIRHGGPVMALAWNVDGSRLATASWAGTAKVWNVLGGESLVVTGHKGGLTGVGWSADGRLLVTASQDGTARVWPLDRSPSELLTALKERTQVCLRPEFRIESLGEDADEAQRRYEQCEGSHGRTAP
jgi:WD40 repeat protein